MGPVTDAADSQLARPGTSAGAKAFIVTPFARMARTHAASTMADGMVAASLAGSLFFSLPAGDARGPVLRYLVITMLPFAVMSPLVGPLIDRIKGGHRLMVIASVVVRSVLCYLMATVINGQSLLFFLYALLLLVCQKAYQVARSALVPTVVRNDTELVEANSKLSLISGIAGFVGVLPAGILLKAAGPEWALGLAMLVYGASAILGLQISGVRVASDSPDETERHELRGAGIIMAGSAMGLIRACVGFLTLLVAFDFRGGGRPTWQFGVVGAASVLSQLGGAAVAPRIRTWTSEENLLTGVLGLLVAGGLVSLLLGDVAGAAILGSCVGFAAGGGKLAFDSILQRDAPDANRGRAFARFETRFQVTWVIGALIPVAITMSASVGFALVLTLAVIALTSYVIGRLAYAHRMGTHQTAATAAAVGIEDRFAEVSGEVRGRLSSAPRAAFRRLRTGRTVDGGANDDYDAYDEYDEHDDDEYDDDEYDEGHEVDGPVGPDQQGGSGIGEAPYDVAAEHRVTDRQDQSEWADQPTEAAPSAPPLEPDRVRRRGRRRRSAADAPTRRVDEFSDDLAAGSSVAWRPPDDEGEFPWQAPSEPHQANDEFLDDVNPAVDNPYPWTPDGGRGR